jgi:hypothetical protein
VSTQEPPEEQAPQRPARERAEGAPRPASEGPTFLAMIGLVAVVVALVIVVFFAIGYILGRVFL